MIELLRIARRQSRMDKLIPVKIMENINKVSGGDSFTLAIQTDGILCAWGSNIYGQLSNFTAIRPPVRIMDNVKTSHQNE